MVTGPAANICKDKYLVDQKYLYPIAGHIGIGPIIRDFTQQAIFGNLSQDFSKDFAKSTTSVQLAEQLQFTTTLDLSVTPKVTFAPVPLVGAGLHVADACFSGEAHRKDVHKLTLWLFLPTPASVASLRSGVLANFYGVPLAGIVSAPAPTPSQRGALDVLNQLLFLKLFHRDAFTYGCQERFMPTKKRKTQPVNMHRLSQILSAIHKAGRLDALAEQLSHDDKIAVIRSDAFRKIVEVASSIPAIMKDPELAATLSAATSDDDDIIPFRRRDFPVPRLKA